MKITKRKLRQLIIESFIGELVDREVGRSMKISRKELRNIIEAFIPGSKADMYNKYGIEGNELEGISNLLSHEEESYQEMGRDMFSSLADTDIITVAYREIKIGFKGFEFAGKLGFVTKKIQLRSSDVDKLIEECNETDDDIKKQEIMFNFFYHNEHNKEMIKKEIDKLPDEFKDRVAFYLPGKFIGYRSKELNDIHSNFYAED